MCLVKGKESCTDKVPQEHKGKAIRISGGKYLGCTGWINARRDQTKCRRYVILELQNNIGSTFEHKTFVDKAHVGPPHRKPANYTEAAIQQHPQVEAALDKACREIIKCNIDDYNDVLELLAKKLVEQALIQQSKGYKARYYDVKFKKVDEKQTELEGEGEQQQQKRKEVDQAMSQHGTFPMAC